MTITKEQWQAVEKELAAGYVNVKFEYKGFELAIQRQLKSENTTALAVYINGEIKGSWVWFNEEIVDRPEIIKAVWKRATKAKWDPKSVKEIEKHYGKRRAKKEYPTLHERHEYWMPFFSKASVLVRQFKKLEGITLIKADCLETEAE